MERPGRNELMLCDLQARTFEQSVLQTACSSEIFIRRFMHSNAARLLDSGAVLETGLQQGDLLRMIEEQYGPSRYGRIKFSTDEMYWIGYIYRYYACVNRISSLQVYRIIKAGELRSLFPQYQAEDPARAVDQILEIKHLPRNEADEFRRQYEIFKKHCQ